MNEVPNPLLDVRLHVEYRNRGEVLRDFHLQIDSGEIYGLAGQSGSGKSTCALAIMRLLDPSSARISGSISFEGRDLLSLPEFAMRKIRGKQISLILQSPLASLNPRLRLGTQLKEAWEIHADGGGDWRARVRGVMDEVSLPSDDGFLRKYPRELSVGMAQRLLIATAVLHRPKLIIADEATSALDVITQSEILLLFRRLSATHGCSVLYITHDLVSAASLCARIGVLHEGRIVESGPVSQVFDHPSHPYTQRLISALPRVERCGGPADRTPIPVAGFAEN